jgi:uncharacterized protein (UPF0264 family)
LLVSVRNAVEAERAIAGGADIIDAKDPAGGAIAPVSPVELETIRAAVPAAHRLSAALGDVATTLQVHHAFGAVSVRLGFVKLGFRGMRDRGQILTLLGDAVWRAAVLPGSPAVIAVGYADHQRAGALPPADFPDLLSRAGAHGLLVDTCFKDGGNLFELLKPADLTAIGKALEREELMFALGGSLQLNQMQAARETGASILGVRGAACRGGREGEVDEALVRQLAQAVCRPGLSRAITG